MVHQPGKEGELQSAAAALIAFYNESRTDPLLLDSRLTSDLGVTWWQDQSAGLVPQSSYGTNTNAGPFILSQCTTLSGAQAHEPNSTVMLPSRVCKVTSTGLCLQTSVLGPPAVIKVASLKGPETSRFGGGTMFL
jgi:hypothetical protein